MSTTAETDVPTTREVLSKARERQERAAALPGEIEQAAARLRALLREARRLAWEAETLPIKLVVVGRLEGTRGLEAPSIEAPDVDGLFAVAEGAIRAPGKVRVTSRLRAELEILEVLEEATAPEADLRDRPEVGPGELRRADWIRQNVRLIEKGFPDGLLPELVDAAEEYAARLEHEDRAAV